MLTQQAAAIYGAIVYIDGDVLTFSTHTPEWVESDGADIYDFEMAASLFGMSLAAVMCPGRPVILCCDNRGATQTLVRGYCKTVTGRKLCSSFWTIASTFLAPLWIQSVEGSLNPSDPPSRDCILRNKPFSVPHKTCEIPNILFEVLKSPISLKNPHLSIPACITGFCNAWPRPIPSAEWQ